MADQWYSGYASGVASTPGVTPPEWTFVGQYPSSTAAEKAFAAEHHLELPLAGAVFGPYQTQAEAAARLAQAHVGGPGSPTNQQQAQGAIANAIPGLSGIAEIGHYIGDFVTHITDVHMWISVGWLLLGLVLVILGILLWAKKDIPAMLGVSRGAG